MILWEQDNAYGLCQGWGKCATCGGGLNFPFVVWFSTDQGNPANLGEKVVFFCSECSADMYLGFSSDMQQMATAKKIKAMGFHKAAQQGAISGGFVWTDKTAKQ